MTLSSGSYRYFGEPAGPILKVGQPERAPSKVGAYIHACDYLATDTPLHQIRESVSSPLF